MRPFDDIHDRARGRWRSMLPALGVSERFLSGRHGPCPCCGGVDRFRWDDKDGDGTFYCNQCGPGNGIDLVMKVRKIAFKDAAKLVAEQCGSAPILVKKASHREGSGDQFAISLWSRSHPLTGFCAASQYLEKRGLRFSKYPGMLRFIPNARYTHADGSKTSHPALVARFVSEDATVSTVHLTYLDDDGNKAAVFPVRKLAPGKIPLGGAVRLSASAETMGIAEGIETALSAAQLFEVPVWSALTAGALSRWNPPLTAKSILVFADNDSSFTGQAAAYALAQRLKSEGRHVEVRIPDLADTDWNDLLLDQTGFMVRSLDQMAERMRA